jgi:hypothetical protein
MAALGSSYFEPYRRFWTRHGTIDIQPDAREAQLARLRAALEKAGGTVTRDGDVLSFRSAPLTLIDNGSPLQFIGGGCVTVTDATLRYETSYGRSLAILLALAILSQFTRFFRTPAPPQQALPHIPTILVVIVTVVGFAMWTGWIINKARAFRRLLCDAASPAAA